MNIESALLWGFAATIILTTLLSASRPLGWTRMDIPFILGTIVTPNRDKAPFYGFLLHLGFGLLFSLIYAAIIDETGWHFWWAGAIIGVVHGGFVLSGGLQLVSCFHPRMAQPFQGPTPTRQLQPPGFFALNYGRGTFIVTMLAHILYGIIIGTFYHPA